MSKLKKCIDSILDSFVQEISHLAEVMPTIAISEVSDLNKYKKIRDIKRLVDTFKEIYSTHIEIYIALEKEMGEPIDLAEKKQLTKLALDLRTRELNKYLRIINVKAQVYLEDIDFPVEQELKDYLLKLSKITVEDMKKSWLEESKKM